MTDPHDPQQLYEQPVPYSFGGPPGGDITLIPEYRGWAIASVFLGGGILGIFAIMRSSEVVQYKMQGDYIGAEQASRTTKTLCVISSILGGIACLFVIVFMILFIVFLASDTT